VRKNRLLYREVIPRKSWWTLGLQRRQVQGVLIPPFKIYPGFKVRKKREGGGRCSIPPPLNREGDLNPRPTWPFHSRVIVQNLEKNGGTAV